MAAPLASADELLSAVLAEPLGAAALALLSAWLDAGGREADLRPLLQAALGHPQSRVRRRALLLTAPLCQEQAAYRPLLLAGLSDPAWIVREAAATAVALVSDAEGQVHARLVEVTLHDAKPQVRTAAARALGPRLEPQRDYGEAIRHPFERQRMRAAGALGHAAPHRAREAVQLLTVALADVHVRVRRAALRGLELLPSEAVLSLLPALVRKCFELDPAIAAAARRLCDALLALEAAAPLARLRPFLDGTAGEELLRMLAALPAEDPLRQGWEQTRPKGSLAEKAMSRRELARLLRYLCERFVGPASRAGP